jgi:hypothetical protein
MKRLPNIEQALSTIAVVLAAFVWGCSDTETDVNQGSDTLTASQGEHGRDIGEGGEEGHGGHERDRREHHGEEGEESGTELALDESYDDVRNGARLVMAYDAQTSSFNGTVENTTEEKLERVRVEVHLSNGKELGPTTPADLGPGEKRDVRLSATSKDFDGWTAHPEVGGSEDGHRGEQGGEGRGEHDRDGGEHGPEGGGEHR